MEHTLKNGMVVELRDALVEDAEELIEFMKIALLESKNLLREPHEWTMTIEDEEKFIKALQGSKDNCMVVIKHNGVIIGDAGFATKKLDRVKHRVSFGISVLEKYHYLGVGTLLTNTIIERAMKFGKTKIDLEVRKDNINAIKLYAKFGFMIEGEIERGLYIDGKYINLIIMGKTLW